MEFASFIHTSTSFQTFEPEDYFSNYFKYEEYDPNKSYSRELEIEIANLFDHLSIIEKNYYAKQNISHVKFELHLYKIHLVDEISRETKENKSYVVYNDVMDEKVIELLLDYCQCSRCLTSKWNPMKYFAYACCVGCLNGIIFHVDLNVLRKTRLYCDKSINK